MDNGNKHDNRSQVHGTLAEHYSTAGKGKRGENGIREQGRGNRETQGEGRGERDN